MKKHSKSEAENIFICGTKTTTPDLESVSQQWPHPWLYSRVFLMFALAFALLYVCCSTFANTNALPGLIVVGSFTVPLTGLILFLEVNAYRNISLYDVALIFLVGGCASLVATLFLFSIVGVSELDFTGALTVGIVEEVGKGVIIYYFIKKLGKRNIFPGLLIGAAVGAGFAAFESAGYAMNFLLEFGWDAMLDVIFLRGFLAPGGHVAWAAITGAAMAIASQKYDQISASILTDGKFLKLFAIPVILHALWDSPLANIGAEFYLLPIALTFIVWVVVLILINMALSEIAKHKTNY
ncbi:MAG: PrsW family intramembrane metalloprotease [Alistipes sp.]|nr:PrsW family intramembrane metalloprotease [Alistipes sp.]